MPWSSRPANRTVLRPARPETVSEPGTDRYRAQGLAWLRRSFDTGATQRPAERRPLNTRSNVSETDAGCEGVNAIVAGFLELRRWTIGVTPNPVRTGGVDVVVVA